MECSKFKRQVFVTNLAICHVFILSGTGSRRYSMLYVWPFTTQRVREACKQISGHSSVKFLSQRQSVHSGHCWLYTIIPISLQLTLALESSTKLKADHANHKIFNKKKSVTTRNWPKSIPHNHRFHTSKTWTLIFHLPLALESSTKLKADHANHKIFNMKKKGYKTQLCPINSTATGFTQNLNIPIIATHFVFLFPLMNKLNTKSNPVDVHKIHSKPKTLTLKSLLVLDKQKQTDKV